MKYSLYVVILMPFLLIGMEKEIVHQPNNDLLQQLEALKTEELSTRLPKIQQLLKLKKCSNKDEQSALQKKLEPFIDQQEDDTLFLALGILNDYLLFNADVQQTSFYQPTEKQEKNIGSIEKIAASLRKLIGQNKLTTFFNNDTSDFFPISYPNPAYHELQCKTQEDDHAQFVLDTEKPEEINLGGTMTAGLELTLINAQLASFNQLLEIAKQNNDQTEAQRLEKEIKKAQDDLAQRKQVRETLLTTKEEVRLRLNSFLERDIFAKKQAICDLKRTIAKEEAKKTNNTEKLFYPTQASLDQLKSELETAEQELKSVVEEQEANIQAIKSVTMAQRTVITGVLNQQFANNPTGQLARPRQKKSTPKSSINTSPKD